MDRLEQYAKENNIPIMQKDGILFLQDYIIKNNIKNILEVGSAIGYSAIQMASLNKDINIVTIERDEVRYNEAVKNIDNFNIPVIALTADAMEGTKEKYIGEGFNDYLSKPIDRYLLNNVATKIIEVSQNKLNIYNGNYDYYINNKIENIKKSNQKISITKEKNIALYNEKKKLSSIERKIEKIENEIRKLNIKLNDNEISTDYIKLAKINDEIQEKNKELDSFMKEWVEVNENIDKVNTV